MAAIRVLFLVVGSAVKKRMKRGPKIAGMFGGSRGVIQLRQRAVLMAGSTIGLE